MAQIRTVDFLPEVFRTAGNDKFLRATLDQAVQQPNLKRTQGYIGQPWGPGVASSDSYVVEPNESRQDYQLEPAVIFTDGSTPQARDLLTYPGYLDALKSQNGTDANPPALFREQFYSWAPFIDFDKIVNYTQYYWLPDGPDVIDLTRSDSIFDMSEILGQENFNTAELLFPYNVEFTNGLRVRFSGDIYPADYRGRIYVVEGVGRAIRLVPWSNLTTAAVARPLDYIVTEYNQNILSENPQDPERAGLALVTTTSLTGYNRNIVSINSLIETGETVNEKDYITINRSSQDLNAWSRRNRWVHVSVIEQTAEILQTGVDINENYRAQRPIVEFDPDLRLFDWGTQGIPGVGMLCFGITSPFSEVAGQARFAYDGVDFYQGLRVIFPDDPDPEVSLRVWQVEIAIPNSQDPYNRVLNLIPTDLTVQQDSCCVLLEGLTQKSQSYRYDNNIWQPAQTKSQTNQAPLYDLYDNNGVSFSDPFVYPGSTFLGNQLFGYAVGTGQDDSVLGFPLRYQNLGGIGDIVFDFYLYTNTFTYLLNAVRVTLDTQDGFVRQYSDRVDFITRLGYETVVFLAEPYQVFNFTDYQAGQPLILDVPVDQDSVVSPVRITVDSEYQDDSTYAVLIDPVDGTTEITPTAEWPTGSVVNVQALSRETSRQGYYQIPKNLEANALNRDTETITLNGIRNHFISGCQNYPGFRGNPVGTNNARDIYNIASYCTVVVQHSAPLPASALFLRNQELDLFNSLDFNAREYEKFKQVLLQTAITNEFVGLTTSQILDRCLEIISSGRSTAGAFYWTDMVPTGTYTGLNVTYAEGQTPRYDLQQIYDFDAANYRGILVYVTPAGGQEQQLLRGRDYQVLPDTAVLIITRELQSGDRISIREYNQTWGSYVPATPTKLGLYPRFQPAFYTDTTYISPTDVIRGHDGSITPAFDDLRDAVLLEFENRIYNNIKVNEDIPFLPADVVPGKFRSTDYTLQQVREILDFNFLAWVGLNKIDYQTQNYYQDDKFTWNYRDGVSVLGDRGLPGFWRGIYRYFYDTTAPHLRPWEMLGFTEQPSWWNSIYGPAPYTRGNRILWDDVRDGVIREPGRVRTDARYARPGIDPVIPVDPEGRLLDPESALIRNLDPRTTENSWIVNDGSPGESAWINSSTYPFVLQKLYALLKPSQYFTYCIDRDLYRYDAALDQWVYRGRGKLQLDRVEVYNGAQGKIKNSYINFVIEYNKVYGLDISSNLEDYLTNIDIRLAYRVAGYTDKKYLRLISDRSTPGSSNRSLLIPDESYSILLYENEITEQLTYSAVNILRTQQGFQISGNGLVRPYFRSLRAISTGSYRVVNILGTDYQFPQTFDEQQIDVTPYGQNFRFAQEVVDFLCSYGAYLESRGVVYEESENNVLLDWQQMAFEFVLWSRQSWGTGSLYQLNPNAGRFLFTRENLVVGNLLTAGFEDRLIDQNRQPLLASDYTVNRVDNTIELISLNEKNLGYFNLRLTNYEHVIVLDNNTVFADVIYDPSNGLRQNRLLFQGVKTADWNGTLNAPGFFIYQQNVQEWDNNIRYNKGDVVYWKGSYYQALETVYPSREFVFSRWSKIGRFIENGTLLPNLATKAQQSSKFYDQFYQTLNTDSNLLGYGLVGFRPRAYMDSIELDLVSQINVYNDFIRSKGTTDSIKYFSGARVDKNQLSYNIFENWAVQRAVYGSTSVNAGLDILLDADRVYSNPSTIQLISGNAVSSADQTVPIDRIYDSTFPVTDANVFPTLTDINPSVPLPTAGYVNSDDVDYRVFDLAEIAELDTYITEIRDNTLIWVAQASDRDWNVYKCQQVNGTVLAVQDNLSGQSRVTFNAPHGLGINEYIFIRFFDTKVDGIYQVRAVLTAKTILIDLTVGDGNNSTIIGNGIALVMRSVRLAQPNDMTNLVQRISLVNGNKIWVDNDHGSWQVLEKRDPYASQEAYNLGAQTGSGLGTATAVSDDATWSLISAPGYQATLGFPQSRNIGGVYLTRNTLYSGASLVAPLVFIRDLSQSRPRLAASRAFGLDIVIGNSTWAAVSAPGTIDTLDPSVNNQGLVCIYRYDGTNLQQYQLLIEPGLASSASGTWGQALAFSQDENTLVVSNGDDSVRLYRRIPYQIQSITQITQGPDIIFFADRVKINRPYQLDLRVGGISISTQLFTVDVLRGLVSVDLGDEPQTLEITRRQQVLYRNSSSEILDVEDYLLVDVKFDTVTNQCINPGVLRLAVAGGTLGILRVGIDYTIHARDVFHPKGVWITLNDTSLYGQDIYVSTGDYFQQASAWSRPMAQGFGTDLDVDFDAGLLAIGNIQAQVGGNVDGAVEIYNRSQIRYELTNQQDIQAWEAGRTFYDPADPLFMYVYVNSDLEYPQRVDNLSRGNYTYNYTDLSSTATIRFNSRYLQIGDVIVIDTGYYGNTQQPTQILTNPKDSEDVVSRTSRFGTAVAMSAAGDRLIVGAPYDARVNSSAGSISYFTDTGPEYGKISTGDLSTGANIVANDSFVINGYVVTFAAAANTAAAVAQAINASYPANISIAAETQGNTVAIYLRNTSSRPPGDLLRVAPYQLTSAATGDAYQKLGFAPLSRGQLISSRRSVPDARFGSKIAVDQRANTVLVYSLYGSALLNTTFDMATTTFDADATEFDTAVAESGSVDFFQLFDGSGIDDLPRYAQIQQITDPDIKSGDAWGQGLSINRSGTRVLIGGPGSNSQQGRFAAYLGWRSAFQETRRQPVAADTRALNSITLYNRSTKIDLAWLDFLDPLQGRVLGAVQQNIDYTGSYDPAQYNVNGVNNRGTAWTDEYVGTIWWDVSNVRFIDYHQGDAEESARLWGTLFPGSTVDIYQWISSPVAPSVYPGPGTPYSFNSYVIFNGVDITGKVVTRFYFWVRGINTVNTLKGKTLSPVTMAQYIENPRSSGVPYIALINPSTVAIYNCLNYLLPENTVLSIDYDRQPQDQNIYAEYDLIKENDPQAFLDASTYRKMIDSYAGIDSLGLAVPDPRLGEGARYGVGFRPRQSMFRDRLAALKNYVTYINSILSEYDITYLRELRYWNLQEDYPAADAVDSQGQPWWNLQVQNLVELGYQNLYLVPLGYRYLVLTDADNNNGWSIYQVIADDGVTRSTELIRRQTYRTSDYWRYVDYYAPGFDSGLRAKYTVDYYGDLSAIRGLVVGDLARVNAAAGIGYQIYQWQETASGLDWVRVAAENGTVQIDISIYDYSLLPVGSNDPLLETRNIIQGINEDIFIDDLLIFRNLALAATFRYIVAEQVDVNWLYKTSFIDVRHPVGQLSQSPLYRRDNQDFVLEYISEVKPYHVQLKEFDLVYTSTADEYRPLITDFDLPSEYNSRQEIFISPILDPNRRFTSPAPAPDSSFYANSNIWAEDAYRSWFSSYGLGISGIKILNPGTGYISPPNVTIQTDLLEVLVPPRLTAVLDSNLSIASITVVDPGKFRSNIGNAIYSNSRAYANVIITSVDGLGGLAQGYVEWTARPVRQFDITIKYDRVNLGPTFRTWQSNSLYYTGDLVKFGPKVWQRNSYQSLTYEGREFSFDRWTSVEPGNSILDGVDRTYGFSTEDPNIVISGLVYPGVRLRRGFVGTFDTSPFGTDPFESDISTLDTLLEGGSFDDFIPRPNGSSEISVVGGSFIDTYSSYAPEELSPGSTFDTLDLQVNTSPGEDNSWQLSATGTSLGWSPQVHSVKRVIGVDDLDFTEVLHEIHHIVVSHVTTGNRLIPDQDYTVDWPNSTVSLAQGIAATNDVISIDCYAMGGGYQTYRDTFLANADITGFNIPVPTAWSGYAYNTVVTLSNVVIVDNGNVVEANYAYHPSTPYDNTSDITRVTDPGTGNPYVIQQGNLVSVVAFGYSYPSIRYLGGNSVYTYGLPWVSNLQGTGSNSYSLGEYRSYYGDNNPDVTVVERDYRRLRGAATVSYVVPGTVRTFDIPYQTDVSSEALGGWANRVNVWVNGSNIYSFTDASGDTVYGVWTYTTAYDPVTDIVKVTLDQDPGPADSNVRVTVGITANVVDYNILKDTSGAFFIDANGNIIVDSEGIDANYMISYMSNGAATITFSDNIAADESVLLTTWNDARQQQLDNRIFVGKNYDIVENSPNNLVTCGRWDDDSNTISLGFITEGVWFGNTAANVTVVGNTAANITINGIPYSFENFDLLPWNLSNVLIVNGLETNESGYIPIQQDYEIFADGLPTGVKVAPPRRSNTGNNRPYFINSVTEFRNFQGRRQYAVLLDQPASTLGIGWQFQNSSIVATGNVNGVAFGNVAAVPNAWVAVGDGGNILFTTNVNSWNRVSQGNSGFITTESNALLFTGNISDANVPNLALITSLDVGSTANFYGVGINGNAVVVVGERGEIWYSNSLSDWQQADNLTNRDLLCVTWAGSVRGLEVPADLLSENVSGNTLLANRALETESAANVGTGDLIETFESDIGNQWLAAGRQGIFMTSKNGISWTVGGMVAAEDIRAVALDDTFVLRSNTSLARYLAFSSAGNIYASNSGGASWQFVSNVSQGRSINGVLRVQQQANSVPQFFTVGQQGTILRNNPGNSSRWIEIAGPRQQQFVGTGLRRTFATGSVRVNSITGVAVSVGGTVLRNSVDYSVDSINPVSITIGGRGFSPQEYANTIQPPLPGEVVIVSGIPDDLYAITYNPEEDRLMVTGANGVVMISTDRGDTWQPRLPFVSSNLRGVAHGGNTFVAVGDQIATGNTYQQGNVTAVTQAAIISSPRGDDLRIEFLPDISRLSAGQMVVGEYVRRQSLIQSIDLANRSIDVYNPLDTTLVGPRFNSVIRIYDIEQNQRYDLGSAIANPDRLWVTVDGQRCFENYANGFTVDGNVIVITANVQGDSANAFNSSVVQILTSSDYSVPNELDFKVWQDMRDNTSALRVTPNNSTELRANLGLYDDVIYLDDISKIQVPAANTFGMVMVGTERIAFRYHGYSNVVHFSNGQPDFANSTANTMAISGLLRGLAGTSQLGDYYDTGNANSASYSNGSTNINRLAHVVDQQVIDVSQLNNVPSVYRDRFNSYAGRAVAANLFNIGRSNNTANAEMVFDTARPGISVFSEGDIINLACDDTRFNVRSAVLTAVSEPQRDPVKDITTQYIYFTNTGSNISTLVTRGTAAKTDYSNPDLYLNSNAEILVAVAGTELRNPQATFDLAGSNTANYYIANTAAIPGQTALFVFSSNEVLVTLAGAEIVPRSSYTVANTNPLILQFNPNTLPSTGQLIITAQNEFQALELDPVRILLKSEPKNNQQVLVSAEYSQSWYLQDGQSLQYQDTAAGRFFRDQA